ncbi:MAG: hypothetical protein NWT02_04540, partial [Opitutales bacterium]|nr:hypothetical protein [Opitutales bacterium]
RAEILGDGNYANNARFWTGIWDTTAPTTAPTWLVSGDPSNPTTLPADLIQLVGPGSAGSDTSQYVSVPIVEVLSNAKTSAQIAWWISDEGVKVSAGQIDESSYLSDQFFSDFNSAGLSTSEQRQLLKQIGGRRPDLKVFYSDDTQFTPSEVEDVRDNSVSQKVEDANDALRKVIDSPQMQLLTGIEQNEYLDSFHDVTQLAKNVISNTELGGLKFDLMDQSFESTASPLKVDDALRKFLWGSSPDANGDIALIGLNDSDIAALNTGDTVTTTPVIITEYSLYFVVSGQSKNSRNARAFLRFEAEMWSPYGFRHKFLDSSGTGSPELSVEVVDMPDINLSFYDKDTESYTNSTTLNFDAITPKFDLNFSDTHKSGEIRKMTGEWPINASSSKSKFYYTNDWVWEVDDPSYNSAHRNISYPDGDSINYTANPSKISLIIRNSDGEVVQQIKDIQFGAISTNFAYYQSSPSSLSVSDAPIAFQYRLLDSIDDLESWLTKIDLRSPALDLSTPATLDRIDLNDVDGDDQGDPDQPSSIAFSNLDFFHGQVNNNFFRLFDLPATTPYSIGVLQHLQLYDTRPFSIGNSWGNDLNEVFDRYFISSIPQNSASSHWKHQLPADQESHLPNPYIQVTPKGATQDLSELQNSKSARYLHQAGSFNFNSTSVLAWEAILGANNIFDWNYSTNKGTSTAATEHRLNLESSFFRLPFSGHLRSTSFTNWKFPFEDYEDETTLGDDYPSLTNAERADTFKAGNGFNPGSEWKPSVSLGHREISQTELATLAVNIVEKLKTRAKPFESFKAFINSGLLQEAIDETDINTVIGGTRYVDAAIDERMPRNATSFLSQADIFSALSPALSPRSDTFKIRAGAVILNPITGKKEGVAYCEATIQRYPDLIKNNPADEMKNAIGLGRKFRIENIKWLNNSQL